MKEIPALIRTSSLSRLLMLCFSLLFFAACQKEQDVFDPEAQRAVDEDLIKDYMAANSLSATRSTNGVYSVITDPGTGPEIKVGDVVSVHYTGSFLDGTTFDTSIDNGSPFTFRIGDPNIIVGFQEGILQLKSGGKSILLIPSDLAYGTQGANGIDPNTVLRFDVELVDQNNVKAFDDRIITQHLTAKNITGSAKTDSGAYFLSTVAGTGAQAKAGDEVAVHYRGKFLNERIFDESNPSSPKTLVIGNKTLGKGVDEALTKMKIGGKATVFVPSSLAFGATGSEVPTPAGTRVRAVPPYTVVQYDLELVAIK